MTVPEKRVESDSIGSLTMSEVEGSQPLKALDPNVPSKAMPGGKNATTDKVATKKRTSTSTGGSTKKRRKPKHHDGKGY